MRLIFLALAALLASSSAMVAQVFTPTGPSITVAATATSQRVNINPSAGAYVRVLNAAATPSWVQCGDSTVVATIAASIPVAGTSTAIIGCGQPYMAVITGTTGTVYLTPGTSPN